MSFVQNELDAVYNKFQKEGGDWSKEKMQRELDGVVEKIMDAVGDGKIKLYK